MGKDVRLGMNFRTKMTGIFLIFILVIALGIGIFYYRLVNRQYEQENRQMLDFYGRNISESMDHNIDFMLDGVNYILSSPEVLNSLDVMAAYHTGDAVSEYYRQEAMGNVNNSIYTSYINSNFYRVIIFNKYGDILVNKNFGEKAVDVHKDISEVSWLARCNESKKATLIVGEHPDDWGIHKKPNVYSVAKKLYGSQETYIEIQSLSEAAFDELHMEEPNIQVVVFNQDGQPMIASQKEYESILQPYAKEEEGMYEADGKLVTVYRISKHGLTVVAAQDKNVILNKNLGIMRITLVIILIFTVVSMLYVTLSVCFLTKPINEMRKMIDETEPGSLSDQKELELPVNELEALNYSYRRLLNRLQEQMYKEQRMALVNLKAQLDILQAQVNPHFIYNVLNVISNRGILCGDEEICKICGCLASMLRYTTNTKEGNAPLGEELHYVEQYYYLLKSRYHHKIEANIEIAEEMKEIVIPKMVIQQILENCVEHGFCEEQTVLKIDVKGTFSKDGWSVVIGDNGKGFEPEKITEIYRLFDEVKRQLNKEEELYQAQIGGMGLVNSYARMFFMFGERFFIKLENQEGSVVTLTVKRGGEEHVSDFTG